MTEVLRAPTNDPTRSANQDGVLADWDHIVCADTADRRWQTRRQGCPTTLNWADAVGSPSYILAAFDPGDCDGCRDGPHC